MMVLATFEDSAIRATEHIQFIIIIIPLMDIYVFKRMILSTKFQHVMLERSNYLLQKIMELIYRTVTM